MAQTSSASGQSRSGQSLRTSEHGTIRQWAEERGAEPTVVKAADGSRTEILRLNFPGYAGNTNLAKISWDEFFRIFDAHKLAFIYQDQTSGGQRSYFNKFVSRERK